MDSYTIQTSQGETNVFIQTLPLHQMIDLLFPDPLESKLYLILDKTVYNLYSKEIFSALEKKNLSYIYLTLSSEEERKNWQTAQSVLQFLGENSCTKKDILLSIGGGFITDISGFCSNLYQRGISLVHIPTTLVGMIDASIGGKNGINMDFGKNQVGTIYHPLTVFCNPIFLSSLREEQLKEGLAELIKYGILTSSSLFSRLKEAPSFSALDWETEIAQCVEIKKEYIEKDEGDNHIRRHLNLGHTIGHAIESLSCYSISHGKAVAMGLAMASTLSDAVFHTHISGTVHQVLSQYGLPTTSPFSVKSLALAMKGDKKRRGDTLYFTLIKSIGEVCTYPVPLDKVEAFLSLNLLDQEEKGVPS